MLMTPELNQQHVDALPEGIVNWVTRTNGEIVMVVATVLNSADTPEGTPTLETSVAALATLGPQPKLRNLALYRLFCMGEHKLAREIAGHVAFSHTEFLQWCEDKK
mgnify:CR=1 FL=1